MTVGAAKFGLFAAAGSAGGATGFAYLMGSDPVATTVDKYSLPDGTLTALVTGLSSARGAGTGMSNSGTAGYQAGGGITGNVPVTTVDKFAYSDDSRSTLGTGLADTRTNLPCGFSNSGTAGYVGGGWSSTGSAAIDSVDKFAFSNDSRSTIAATLTANTQYIAAMANSGTAGYTLGGYTGSNVSTVDKFAFSDDSVSTLGTGLSTANRLPAGMANSGTAGYCGGGYTSTSVDTVDKFAFSDDSRTTLGTGLSAASYSHTGWGDTGAAGYFAGGTRGSATDKFSFADDSRSSGTSLTSQTKYVSTAANEGALA